MRLAAFIFPQYAAMMQTDEMDFASMGERKRAIFCVIPVNDGSMNYLVSMLMTQCFQQLYLRADERYNGRLPMPVRVIQDEWANVAQPDSYPKVLATCRSYNIGINIIVQNIQSIKALYKDEWEGIIGNCDTLLFLGGGNEPTSLEFVSKLLGKETVHTRTRGQTKGRSGSSSVNFQQTGRDLMTPDEIRMLPTNDALLFIRGEKPVRDKKYDIKKHPNVRRTADGRAKPYSHKAIDAGLEYLSSVQLADGSFANMSKETPDGEVTLAVLKMMEALDISLEDERFVKNGNTVADAMQTFYVDGVGFISNFDVEAPLDNLEILPRYDNPNMGVSDTISALTYLQAAENGKFGPDGTGNSVFEIVGSALTETPLGAILLAVIIVALLAFGMVRRYRRIKKEQ